MPQGDERNRNRTTRQQPGCTQIEGDATPNHKHVHAERAAVRLRAAIARRTKRILLAALAGGAREFSVTCRKGEDIRL